MAADEFARPPLSGTGTGPREVALYMGPRPDPAKPPVIPTHIELLDAEVAKRTGTV